jgi:uncharacterized peroxidase-related enzyme
VFIDTPASEPADPTVAAAYQAATAQFGFLPNWALAFGGRPAVLEAWQRLNVSIRDGMDRRRYELATIAAAQRLSSTYCTLAHSWMLSERLNLIGTDELGSILTDRASAPALSEVDRAVMDFADQVAGDASGITEGDVARLRGLGLSDTDVLDVALAAAARCFFAKVLDAVGAEADPELAEAVGPELTAAATLGRPVQPVDD